VLSAMTIIAAEFLAPGFSQVPAGFRIALEILDGVLKRHPVARHELIHFRTGLKPEHAPHLRTAEHTCAVTLDCEALEHMLRHITPVSFEAPLDVFRKFDLHFHKFMLPQRVTEITPDAYKGRDSAPSQVISAWRIRLSLV
jgi:hypothetical protein